ncbi:hypothetical protein RJ639_019099 [Escallonia herrerae]|uniref:Uncharacterized protein n=1 Tax=Escallonia herrerae TaxID=1293975 RepID=A0AA88V945_9ASTE|nr:hypothetical protein RJ639_019099 [Escallonia herrerae]
MGKPSVERSSKSGQDVHTAARSGDLNAVLSMCSSNPLTVNSRDKHSRTPYPCSYIAATWSGHAQVVSYLCKNKADVGAAAMDDMSAIHFAAQKGHLEVVRILLSSGASVKASTRKGMTALHYAVQGSHLELVKYLVKKGANLSAKTKARKTPLDLASSEEIRSALVEREMVSSKGDLNGEKKAEEGQPMSSPQENVENSVDEASAARHEEAEHEKDESAKRKAGEGDIKEAPTEPKKAKVALNHLLTSDDTQEEEEHL